MIEKIYLIYFDILGFDALAAKLAGENNCTPEVIRKQFIDVIKQRVDSTEAKGIIIGKKYGNSDDWLLVVDNVDNIFECVFEITSHDTGLLGCRIVPMEIAIGTAKLGIKESLRDMGLIIQSETIKFYKTGLVDLYRKYYEEKNKNRKVTSTFVVLTESLYGELEPLDRKICELIECKKDGQNIRFYEARFNNIRVRGQVFNFLKMIGHPGYRRIDEVFVPPLEFDELKSALEQQRVIFITGTQEFGKTYTAVRLMWEYYTKGYIPKWIAGTEKEQRVEVRKTLADIREELKSGQIIYLEDPFGKIEYEGTPLLEREIGTILESLERVKNAYVIITSREEVFKEFSNQQLSAKLGQYEQRLNIKKPSYDYERKKMLLLAWAEEEGYKWFESDALKRIILHKIRSPEILPTPLSMRDFCVSTVNIDTEEQLIEKMSDKSEPTEKAFAKEIEGNPNMAMDHERLKTATRIGPGCAAKMRREKAGP